MDGRVDGWVDVSMYVFVGELDFLLIKFSEIPRLPLATIAFLLDSPGVQFLFHGGGRV